ncbi:hypothetical protein PGRAN_08369 [Listeria grandensis FSL F6-0971]|uniref:DUF4097 domain-containing protein n=1 Tax=Listeria grandensis FSL F6-0971 TaxID=1265819 RepID=W7BT02_9LIST|nr:DUF4097 family beta strand repeat-containing protein [Listeria grandensis]EUJ23483.1 hypothetical protein PGRAN_08369 [Listeria grandensis FSL F6-0971]
MFKNKWKLLIIGAALLLVGGIGFGLTFNNDNVDRGEAYHREWQLADGDISLVKLMGDQDMRVNVTESTTGKSYVTMNGHLSQEAINRLDKSVKANQDNLTIDIENKQEWFSFLEFQIYGEQTVTIHVAKGAKLGELATNLSSSDLSAHDVTAKMISLKAGSGKIEASNLTADTTVVTNSSGNIDLKNVTSDLEVTNGSGDNEIQGVNGDKLSVASNSGDIEVKSVTAKTTTLTNGSGSIDGEQVSGAVKVDNNSGDIDLSGLNDAASVNSGSGEVDLDFSDLKKDVTVDADSGDVNIEIPTSFAGFLDLRSNSGDIKSPNIKTSSKTVVKVRTGSGNIKIEQ